MTTYLLPHPVESAEQARDRLERAVDAAELGTFYCPLPLDRLFWNARCKVHFWLDPDTPDDEIDIDTFYRILHADDRASVRAAVDAAVTHGGLFDIEYRTVSARGDVRWLRAKGSAHVGADGRPVRLDGITIDISAQKRLERERDALIESERVQRFAAQSASGSKDAFIAAVSHELRAPSTAILGWADMLGEAADDPAVVREGVAVIRRNILALTRLVDDLLDASRLGQGKFAIESAPVSIAECLNAALQDVVPIAETKGVRIAEPCAGDGLVSGDAARLEQVFRNLLDNALKHTQSGGQIMPSLVVGPDTVQVRIADTGAGIPADRLEQIFEPFLQIRNPLHAQAGGLGLGLSIARSIVVMHGGEIAACSDGPGKGATFTVTLPRLAQAGHRERFLRDAAPSDTSIEGSDILLVEDDADARDALATILRLKRAVVRTASSAEEARLAIRGGVPDLIVCDLTMPEETGIDFARTLRRDGIDIPMIALTGHAREEDMRMATEAGFDAYLTKPIDTAHLVAAIEKLVHR
ncbi:hybrid sensor histidine kinase/response regulator [Burkholderia multivorans]|uniref:hybrid sensor histidine kinase/response regulator n=1 Tax=Burkholderia multivorans TaxID=87883 RepID=UPI0009E0D5C3|nr:ATP-binding protein [Burkholderia multivorans]SAJ63144.1 PAS/PAC sensor hybrid histidine kinase [Burkholderia multivorans]SAJ91938.1 PAS/PAC sensor hybrid histidine kinase [Burkholderia multivorans]HEM7808142.1 response regulator [Burkholderia multivorans]HEM7813018.1 response regulator [Burkholderia multivorans]HEM7818761.1 response regulator [Burkholderia multivorans]